MEFKEAIRVWKRMCGANSECNGHCVLYDCCPGGGMPLEYIECSSVNKIEAILAKWAEEHPERTIMDDFFEKFPKAQRDDNGCPTTCARRLGYVCECPIAEDKAPDCVACWRRPLEEVEG